MLDFSATDAAFSGFRFVRQHPLVVLIWAGLHFVVGVVLDLSVLAKVGPILSQVMASGGARDPAATSAMIGQLAPAYGVLFLLSLLFYPVVLAATSRAVLEPQASRFAYLSLGMDEVRQLLLFLLIVAVGIGVEIALFVALLIVGAITRAAGPAAASVGVFCSILAILGALVFCGVRLSLAFPATYARRKVSLFKTWSLTRGRFWKMFGTYVLTWALAFLVYLLVALILGALGAAVGAAGAGWTVFAPSSAEALGAPTPASVILFGLSTAANALLLPVLLMPVVEIYRQVRPEALNETLDLF
jgi:hypothetical protein